MNILNKIIEAKRAEVQRLKAMVPINSLEKSALFEKDRPSFYDALSADGPCIIAEFKRMSPSKGTINANAQISEVIPAYQQAGAVACSILTDSHFAGESDDLLNGFNVSSLPLLRKDFVIDEYQIVEARSLGASAILLISSVLTSSEIKQFSGIAHKLQMDVLFEVHNKEEIEKADVAIRIFGVNNRNLNSFQTDVERSFQLIENLPPASIKVSESGLNNPETVKSLYKAGYKAFLIGENFMKTEYPGEAAKDFINMLK